jgi:hypothetical protein
MWRLRRKRADGGGTAVAEPPAEALEDFDGATEELLAEIERLSADNRAVSDRARERRLLRLRHIAGRRLLDGAGPRPAFADPDRGRLPAGPGLPEIDPGDLTAGLLRAGILRDGCLLVRGLVDPDAALGFAQLIERAFAEREADEPAAGYYEEFAPHPRFKEVTERPWIKEGGGVLAADSPRLTFAMLELFRGAGLPALVSAYLGEPALYSVQKTTLRRAEPSVPGAWHQDGAFMGDVRSLNLWLALSRCGDEAPGLDLVPRRLDGLVAAGTDEAILSYQVSQRVAEQAAGDVAIVRPVFEPGDALFFDELFLHQTASDPSMPHARFAIENWFFGPSGFPTEFAPLVV